MSEESAFLCLEPLPGYLSEQGARLLGPNRLSRDEARKVLTQVRADSLFSIPVTEEPFAQCCLSGLWLRYGWLNESHEISQQLKFREGSYWHGLMHREEQDYWNSKYWFDRTGPHPIHELIFGYVQERGESKEFEEAMGARCWFPDRFVDWIERIDRGNQPRWESLRDGWKAIEWELLFRFCGTCAVGARE